MLGIFRSGSLSSLSILTFWMTSSFCHGPLRSYGGPSWQDFESVIPLEDAQVDQPRYVRQVYGTTLKKDNSKFNDDLTGFTLPNDLVEVSRNISRSTYNIPDNITGLEEKDLTHIYYTTRLFDTWNTSRKYYVDLDKFNDSVVSHEGLSKSHLKAAGITLTFDFPFYGNKIRNLTLATGGFLYTGNPDHSWIAATQYIAPLMADFDFLYRNDSIIRYYDNGTALTVEWKNAVLHEKPAAGTFTFQMTLRDDGTIIFFYNKIPIPVQDLPNDTHPVKVGVSDAYMIDRQRFIIRYRTIYEYHRIALHESNIVNDSALVLKALPTCISSNSCESCMSANVSLSCVWCEQLQRCSDGIDRYHQEWHAAACHLSSANSSCSNTTVVPTVAPKIPSKVTKSGPKLPVKQATVGDGPAKKPTGTSSSGVSDYSTGGRNRTPPSTDPNNSLGEKSKYTLIKDNLTNDIQIKRAKLNGYVASEQIAVAAVSSNYGVAIAVVLSVVLVGSLIAWVAYAYLRPQTSSGQWLIRYRPNQWRRNRDDEIQIASTTF